MRRRVMIGLVPLWDEEKESIWMLPGYADDFTRELDEAVQSVRKNEKWRLDYMILQM